MSYITEDKREILRATINNLHQILVGMQLDDESNSMEGNLNYIITRLLRMCYGSSYEDINSAIGMLQCTMLEHYRTVAAPFAEQSRFDNGDIDGDLLSIQLTEVIVEKQ